MRSATELMLTVQNVLTPEGKCMSHDSRWQVSWKTLLFQREAFKAAVRLAWQRFIALTKLWSPMVSCGCSWRSIAPYCASRCEYVTSVDTNKNWSIYNPRFIFLSFQWKTGRKKFEQSSVVEWFKKTFMYAHNFPTPQKQKYLFNYAQ